jgi:hypothetical protein
MSELLSLLNLYKIIAAQMVHLPSVIGYPRNETSLNTRNLASFSPQRAPSKQIKHHNDQAVQVTFIVMIYTFSARQDRSSLNLRLKTYAKCAVMQSPLNQIPVL